jgi:hypothetical protein
LNLRFRSNFDTPLSKKKVHSYQNLAAHESMLETTN